MGKEPPWKPHARPDDGYVPPPELGTMHFEMKNQVTLNIRPWWKQAKEDRDPGQAPVLIFALDSKQVLVAMSFEDWQWLADLALGKRRKTLTPLSSLEFRAIDVS